MTVMKFPLILAVASCIALSACTDPATLGGADTSNTQKGALIGAGVGAVAGQIIGGDAKSTALGAAVGAAVGGAAGYNLDQQEAELRNQLDGDVTITNTGDRLIVTMPQDLLFATDSFSVRPDLQDDLASVADSLNQYPDSTVQVVGHTDSDGEAGYNQGLSERRAGAVAGILRNAGVPDGRIEVIGLGESQPVASNLNAEGKAQNRRVDIVILPTV